MTDFSKVLEWLAVGGSISVVSWLVSWLLNDLVWWQNLKAQYKKLIILFSAILIGIVAKYLILHEELLAAIKPYLDTFIMIVVAWLATQVAHKVDKITKVKELPLMEENRPC